MLCYLDTAFCRSKTCQNKCGRQLTKDIQDAADKHGLPVCTGVFCDERSQLMSEISDVKKKV